MTSGDDVVVVVNVEGRMLVAHDGRVEEDKDDDDEEEGGGDL